MSNHLVGRPAAPFRRARRPSLTEALLAAALTLSAGAALAHDFRAGALTIDQPWSRATPAGAQVAGGFMTIRNAGPAEDRLIGGASEIAGRLEIHEMGVVDGVMRMRPVEQGLAIKPGEAVELKPGSYHIMFFELKRQLKQGERFKGELQFEKAGTIPVEFAVESIGAQGAGQGSGAAHQGHGG
ncbi:copper chaperone PCu(A)C [Chelatococcus sp. SYSU_G07232]|uniref:Copper chaperone PCu(A)C n=1 Tax=Chelatococcus albus TaxID=3047466 RepID=A0ABT7AKC9_9HYPH|nr:copper chaperone PCu(A)C [Chelatococcus sp. SYSU_G07232]MDJ1159825.1 copper chaperone PCu(A)C [Chelatococcus sp. SYSU_G07232]